ncbi:hypothetical protein [Marinifilum sp. D737]|uniref:hypothetical protein n=1 Tax=Marinifilum sp. D737 TaxID=2969628 RepID=UPI002274FEE4|nr:hypothetical protein [Marinifilum sp. D737]MCY1636302.1 hypothetical protein [Marinifilum sp. D737]
MRPFQKTFLLIHIILAFNNIILAQPIPKQSIKNIINGKTWTPSLMNSENSQLFLNSLNLKGQVQMQSTIYQNVILGYDLEQDEILATIKTRNNTKRIIALNKSELEEFKFSKAGQDFHFKRGDLIHENLNENTYYQVTITNGLVYVIHRKLIKILRQKTSKYTFKSANNIYIIQKGLIHPIRNRRDLLKIYTNNSSEIKKFIQQNKLKINPKHPMDIIPVVLKYDS